MLLRTLPDLAPSNTRFRAWFYQRWGRENCLVFGRSRHAEYGQHTQRLSIKIASGGRERYFVGARSIAVDDDNYLILNDGRTYGSLIRAERAVESFSIFFRPGLLEEVLGELSLAPRCVLDRTDTARVSLVEFDERLIPHDRTVTPVMRYIRHHLLAGVDDEQWYDEQLHVLAERLLVAQRRIAGDALRIDSVRASTRREILRRLGLAADLVNSSYERDIGLADMAAAACMSRYHFLRLFRQVHGLTPIEFLYRKRMQAAERLVARGDLCMQEIASSVGFGSRATFYRQWQRWKQRAGN
jgi:AraC-like DNA-binding protein